MTTSPLPQASTIREDPDYIGSEKIVADDSEKNIIQNKEITGANAQRSITGGMGRKKNRRNNLGKDM